MNVKLMHYYLVTPPVVKGIGCSAVMGSRDLYFSSDKKLAKWRKANPDLEKDALCHMFEISLECCKELVKLSKKKVKQVCQECGR